MSIRASLIAAVAALPSFAIVSPAWAQDDHTIPPATADAGNTEDREITVVATGLSRRDDGAYPLSIIEDAEIRSVQGPDLTRVLQRLPGVTITRNGGLGALTSVRVRGAGAEQLLVLIDGVRVNDVSAPGGGFDFGNLVSGEISKIELLRGAHSVIWGSDAIAGVMNLTTRAADGLSASAEYGGAEQFVGQAQVGHQGERLGGTLSGGYITREGFSAAETGTEADGFEQYHVDGRARLGLGGGWSAVANGRFADGALEIDGFPAPAFTFADTLERQDSRERSGRIGIEKVGGRFALRAGLAHARIDRDLVDETVSATPYNSTEGRQTRTEAFAAYDFGGALEAFRLNFGGTYEWSEIDTDDGFSPTSGEQEIGGGHALLTFESGGLRLSGGGRYDESSRFGGEWTFGGDAGLRVGPVLVRGSYGEGFKVPTLYQTFSIYGDPTLQPERSRSYDAGVELATADGSARGAVSVFRRDAANLIDFNLASFTYFNVGRARAEGFEVEGQLAPDPRWRMGLAYSYVDTTDRTPGGANLGNDLARRPRHALTATADWQSPYVVMLGVDTRLVGDSFDNAGNTVPLDGYALVDLRASLPVADRFELYGRIENLFDTGYRQIAGYATQGRAGYVGVRLRL